MTANRAPPVSDRVADFLERIKGAADPGIDGVFDRLEHLHSQQRYWMPQDDSTASDAKIKEEKLHPIEAELEDIDSRLRHLRGDGDDTHGVQSAPPAAVIASTLAGMGSCVGGAMPPAVGTNGSATLGTTAAASAAAVALVASATNGEAAKPLGAATAASTSSAVGANAAAPIGPATPSSTAGTSARHVRMPATGGWRDSLTPLIERAQKECADPLDTAQVWVQLESFGAQVPPLLPFVSLNSGGPPPKRSFATR